MWESIQEFEPVIRLSAFLGIFAIMMLWEVIGPRRKRSFSRLTRWPNNIGIVIFNTAILRVLFPTAAVGMALVPILYADYRPEVREIATLFFVYVPLGALALHAIGMFQGGLRLATWNLLRVLVNAFYLAFILVFLVLGLASVLSFATSLLLGNLAVLVLTVHLIQRAGWLGWRPDFALMKRLSSISGRSTWAASC